MKKLFHRLLEPGTTLEKGVNFFDTAVSYQGGTSEQYVGRILCELTRREDVVVATKSPSRTPMMSALSEKYGVSMTEPHHVDGAVNAVELTLTDEDCAYLEALYVPHKLVGVMAKR